jgi:hypothetical protein
MTCRKDFAHFHVHLRAFTRFRFSLANASSYRLADSPIMFMGILASVHLENHCYIGCSHKEILVKFG